MTLYLGKTPVGLGRVVEKKVAKKKFGATVDSFLGDVDKNGVLQPSTEYVDLVFDGVKGVKDYGLYKKFADSSSSTTAHSMRVRSVSFPDLTSIVYINSCYGAFTSCKLLTSVSMPLLQSISNTGAAHSMFSSCDNLIEVDMSSLKRLGAGTSVQSTCYYMFQRCLKLTKTGLYNLKYIYGGQTCHSMYYGCKELIDTCLQNLTIVSGDNNANSMFNGCVLLQKTGLSSLTTLSGRNVAYQMFSDCTELIDVELPNLSSISGEQACQYMFSGCTGLITASFPSLKTVSTANALGTSSSNGMFAKCTALTEIHFRADAQSVIEALSGYSSKFGATNASIIFDL